MLDDLSSRHSIPREQLTAVGYLKRTFHIDENTAPGVLAAFETKDRTSRYLVGICEEGGDRRIVVERQAVNAASQGGPVFFGLGGSPGEQAWRDEFTLDGRWWNSTDPTFLGFVTPAPDAWREALDALQSGDLTPVSVEGVRFLN